MNDITFTLNRQYAEICVDGSCGLLPKHPIISSFFTVATVNISSIFTLFLFVFTVGLNVFSYKSYEKMEMFKYLNKHRTFFVLFLFVVFCLFIFFICIFACFFFKRKHLTSRKVCKAVK